MRKEIRDRIAKAKMSGVWGGRTTNYAERKIALEYAAKGYSVIRGGWPDFLAIRGDEVVGIEVKSDDDPLSPDQKVMHALLPFPVIVERVGAKSKKKL